MSFPIDITIPAAGNNPSNDQHKMLQNNINVNSYLTVDHVVPGAATGQNGIHLQSSYVARAQPITLTNAVNLNASNGIAYVNNATVAGSSFTNDYYYYNGGANYPLHPIRAYGAFAGAVAPAPAVLINGFNIFAGIHLSLGLYAIGFTQPASGTNYGVLIGIFDSSATQGTRSGYTVVQNAGGISIQFSKTLNGSTTLFEPTQFTVAILGV